MSTESSSGSTETATSSVNDDIYAGVNIKTLRESNVFVGLIFASNIAILTFSLWMRGQHSSDVWHTTECSYVSYALVAFAGLSVVTMAIASVFQALKRNKDAAMLVASALAVCLASFAFRATRFALVNYLISNGIAFPSSFNSMSISSLTVSSSSSDLSESSSSSSSPSDVIVGSELPADVIIKTCLDLTPHVFPLVSSFSLVICILCTLQCLYLLRQLSSVWFIWIPMQFYAAIFYFFPKQRIFLTMFAVLLIMANVKAAANRDLGQQSSAISSQFMQHLATAQNIRDRGQDGDDDDEDTNGEEKKAIKKSGSKKEKTKTK